MRHSSLELTTCAPKLERRGMNTYTHLNLADTAGAVAALPAL